MTSLRRRLSPTNLVELALAIGVVAGFGWLCWQVHRVGYLPPPFLYDTSDTFMDWFNPAYYARTGGAHDVYGSVYAPLSFVVLKLFSTPGCYDFQPRDARACDMLGTGAILACFALCVILAGWAFCRKDRSTALSRTIAFGFGLPMLYALERGNLIMLALLVFIPFFGGLVRSKGGMALGAAWMINIKSYMLFPVLGLIVRREWRLLEIAGFATIGLYCLTLATVGTGTPFELHDNLRVWFDAMSHVVWGQINYSTTYVPFLQFDADRYPVLGLVRPEVLATRALCLLCVGLGWLYPRAISLNRLAFFLLMQSFIANNPGGYAQTFLVFLVFLEKWENPRVGLAIVLAYLLSIPVDLMAAPLMHVARISWLTGREVDTIYGTTVGALVRPGLIVLLTWSLALDSLIGFRRAMRAGRPTLAAHPQAVPA